jgi:hypothetical protein
VVKKVLKDDFFNLKKLPIVNNRPLGENSPNLVTLLLSDPVEKVKRKRARLKERALTEHSC